MAKVYAVYSRVDKSLFSHAIRWRITPKGEKLFPYSHVGLILEPDKKLITLDSLVTESSVKGKGVHFSTLKSFMSHASAYLVTELHEDTDRFDDLLNLAKRYEGTKYDLKGAVGLGVGENWQEDDAFWCSEWFAFKMKKIAMSFMRNDIEHRIDPRHCFLWPQTPITLSF